jgi:DNA polymerase-3 subunit gamma/tau
MEGTLYRKYRSKNFDEIRGQEQVVIALRGAIQSGNFAHAYLFSGSRGTGKTSVARIFAKEIGTTQTDLYEIDAASNRGIDEVRELREAVSAAPYESEYKVYIIDEVHMLTTPAFNALLKTLEEPPPHAVFILATTEFDKLPDTIVSRCEVHHFKKASFKDLKEMVQDVVRSEGYKIDASSDDLIALLGDGSYRDTLGVLQKIMRAIPGKEIKREDVERITGAPRGELVNEYITSLASRDVASGLQVISEAVGANVDMKVFLTLVLEKVRAVLLLRNASGMEAELKDEFLENDMEHIQEWALGREITSATLKKLLDTSHQMSYATLAHVPLELLLFEEAESEDGEDDKPKLLKE